MIALGAPKLYHNFGPRVKAWCAKTTQINKIILLDKPGALW